MKEERGAGMEAEAAVVEQLFGADCRKVTSARELLSGVELCWLGCVVQSCDVACVTRSSSRLRAADVAMETTARCDSLEKG